jgi:hypothetical protein
MALGVGLALLYVPMLRRPAGLLVFAVLLTAAAWWMPDAALLVGQASLLGIALALIAGLMRGVERLWSGGRARRAGRTASDSRISGSGSRKDSSLTPHSTISAPGPLPAPIAQDSHA